MSYNQFNTEIGHNVLCVMKTARCNETHCFFFLSFSFSQENSDVRIELVIYMSILILRNDESNKLAS